MTTPADTPQFMTVKEVADYLRVSKMTVYRLVQDGSLPAVRFGRNYRIFRVEAYDFIRRHHQSPGPQA